MCLLYYFDEKQLERMRTNTLADGVYKGNIYKMRLEDYKVFRLEVYIRIKKLLQEMIFVYTCPVEKCAESPLRDLLLGYEDKTTFSVSGNYVEFAVKNVTDSDGIIHTEITEFLYPPKREPPEKKISIAESGRQIPRKKLPAGWLEELLSGCEELIIDDSDDENLD